MAAGRVVVIGDIMLDVRAQLATDDFAASAANQSASSGQLSLVLAGTGVNMARALGEHFDDVHLIGACGQDTAGEMIRRLLSGEAFATHLLGDAPTSGMVLVLRDGPRPDAPHGDRIVVADRAANDSLRLDLETEQASPLSNAALVCVDAYGLLHEPRRTATREVMALARRANAHVFCDLVPHDLHRHVSVDQCRRWLTDATIVGTSVLTISHLLDSAARSLAPGNERDVTRLAELAVDRLNVPTILVRYGYGHCSWSLAYHREAGTLWCEPTAYPHLQADKVAGYGDHLTADELRRICDPAFSV